MGRTPREVKRCSARVCLAADSRQLGYIPTMGRGLDEDYAYFLAAAAAGRHAAALL